MYEKRKNDLIMNIVTEMDVDGLNGRQHQHIRL